jgi:hypothetical protein
MNAIAIKPPSVSAGVVGALVSLLIAIGAFAYMYFSLSPFNGTPVSSFKVTVYDTGFISKDLQFSSPQGVFAKTLKLSSPQDAVPVVQYQPTDLQKVDVFNYEK